ncbi:aspartate-glutamate racemase family [Actinidia rufa]|uniref:Aspartate-glutamate racemase family n=1 Tax=Actinidia rufa TaxID=165716 RepID=A0A7J0FMB0_9ERIC|nr:aspartate-glutamate racemase family [Actinidia rufa]
MAIQISSVLLQSNEGGKLPESKKISSSSTPLARCRISNPLLSQANTVGIIGGVSVFSTLIFLEKLVWRSSRDGNECVPFVVCSDPGMSRELPFCSSYPPVNGNHSQFISNSGIVVENLRRKREFLEKSGARCIVMPCHISHAWLFEVSDGCSVPFLDMGDCVARELKEAKMKPLEAGSDVRIGVLASDATLVAGFYQEKLRSQGFEVVLPDKATLEHTVVPAIEALNRKDMEGARNLLRIAIHVLLVRAVNCVVLASDEFHSLLPRQDPLHKKCIDPIDALVRFTIKWSQSTEKVHKQPSKKLS